MRGRTKVHGLNLPNVAVDAPNGFEWAACNNNCDVVDGTPLTDDV